MKGLVIFGIVLLLAGLGALIVPSISYTKTHKAVDLGPIEVTTQNKERIPLPPVLGIVMAATGVTLIALGRRSHA